MKWINVNDNYLDFLREYENRIPRTNYGNNKYKPFLGVYLRLMIYVISLKYLTQNLDIIV